MVWLRRILLLAVLVPVVAAGILIGTQNATTLVSMRVLDWQSPEFGIFWWLLSGLCVGFALGCVVALGWGVGAKLRERSMGKRLGSVQAELQRTRSAAVHD